MNRAEKRRQKKLAQKARASSPATSATRGVVKQDPAVEQAMEHAVPHHVAGRLAEAEVLYRQVLETDPDHPDALNNLGDVLTKLGRYEDAAASLLKALAINPQFTNAHNNLGNAYKGLGRMDDALASYGKAIAIDDTFAVGHNNLASAFKDLGKLEQAVTSCHKALTINPNYAQAHNNLGNVLIEMGRFDEAALSYQKTIALMPDFAEAHSNLGAAYLHMGRFEEAIASYRKALSINPDFAQAYNNLGNVYKSLGDIDQALSCYRKALSIEPDFSEAHSNLLLNMQYKNAITASELIDEHVQWDARFGKPLAALWPEHNNERDPEKPLHIGFVSPDLGTHPVGYLLIKLLENKLAEENMFFCYSDRKPDDMTRRIRDAADGWADVRGISDDNLAHRIEEDKIDILFDIAGHTAKNRLLVVARKPAPIGVSWGIGYPNPTGLTAIDYQLSDIHHSPESEDGLYREKIIRMSDGMFCYDPPSYAPDVGPPPSQRNGFVTFASFSNPAKINAATMAVWMKILAAVPDSRLLLKYKGIDDASTRARLLAPMAAHGLEPSRLILEGRSPHPQLLGRYNDVDIALDTFPYSGGLTSCEALWMGVATITLPGMAAAGRHTLSHLVSIGLPELIATDQAHYVALAGELAADLPRRKALRTNLRARMAASPLCDGPRFARNFATITRKIWQRWCADA